MRYIPALRYDFLTPLYDAGTRLTMPEVRMKRRLLETAALREGLRTLDIGCGTGTLLIMAARLGTGARLTGIDIDPPILRRARRKASRAGTPVGLALASATELPFRAGTLDRVLSTLMLHHLDAGQKRQAVSEVFRTLRPGGELHLADFGPPSGPFTRLASFVITRLGHEYVEENLEGRIPRLMAEAGFEAVAETSAMATIFGTVRMYRGAKPTSSRIPSRDR